MWLTLVKKSAPKQLLSYVSNSKKVVNKVIGSVVKKFVGNFEVSDVNSMRSVKVLYSNGLMSKEKYKAVRSNLSMSCSITSKQRRAFQIMKGVRLPKLLTYDKVKQYVNHTWNAATVHDFSELYEDLDESQKVNGGYRELTDILLELADLFISIDETFGEKSHILHFSDDKYHFHVACGADGGSHITSEKENFLLAGANCSENHIVMQRFARRLVHEFQSIKKQTFLVRNYTVKFSLKLFPSDMKFLASYSGELSNAAYYFSSFSDVNDGNKHITNGSLGPKPENTWHPWVFSERLEVAAAVNELKEKLSKTSLAESTKRTKEVLNFIRGKNSRQKHEPLIGPFVGYAEPLHNANNAWQFIHNTILSMSLDRSKIPSSCKDIADVPENSCFARYLCALKTEVRAGRLLKKVKKWFNSGRKGSFDYRFTGKETEKLCHKFMYLVAALESEGDSPEIQMRLCAIAHCALELRGAVSLFSRVNIQERDLIELEDHCLRFVNAVSTMLQTVSPTVWTIGYAVPYHTRILFNKYKLGLGVNSMQGREAKHVRLQQYTKHASLASRWEVVLKHDFVTSGLEGLTHITLGIQSVLTSIFLHVSAVTAFAFVGIQRTPMQRSASFAPLLSTKKLPKQQT